MIRWLALLALGCPSDPVCGPVPSDQQFDIIAHGPSLASNLDKFTSSANNDCTFGSVTALNVVGTSDSGAALTLCVSEPDKLGAPQPLVSEIPNTPGVHVAGFSADNGSGCTYVLDAAVSPTGTAQAEGLCGNGSDPRGYTLTIDGTIGATQTCGSAVASVTIAIAGSAPVVAQ